MNTTGAITMTGNTLLTCPPAATGCIAARSGTASTLAANNDNAYNMIFVDIDGDASTFNSSRNTLSVPADSTVAWAGLYWGADTTAGTGGTAAATPGSRNQVRFRIPGTSAYQTITASQVDTSPVTGGVRYQGFADVTDLVVEGRSGEYTTANVQAGRGNDRYGGWALVVAYQDPSEPLRNLTIFDGYAVVQQSPVADQNVAIPVSGFRTPESGPVRSRVGVVAYEGDLGLLGDSLRLNSTPLTNSLNPATNFFNSSLSGFGSTNTTGDPFQTNMLGFDIDTIQANGVLANGATSATINLNTTNDTYFPGVVSFSTELFAPQLDLAKSGADVDGGPLDVGDEILYTVAASNTGDDSAINAVVTDLIPDGTTYLPGSLKLNGIALSDATGDDSGEIANGPNRIVVRLDRMPIAGRATVSFRVVLDEELPNDEVISNTATASYTAATSGLALQGLSNTVVLTPRPRSDLSLLKFTDASPVTVPGVVSFQIVARNRGPATEPEAVVADSLPNGFVASGASSSSGSCAIAGNSVTCALGALEVGEAAVVDVTGTVASGSGTITNTASISGANLDLNRGNNSASATIRLNNPPSAIDHLASTPSGSAVVIPALMGAADPDADLVSIFSAGSPASGVVVVNNDGTVTYTPAVSFKGDDSFDYTVTDGKGGLATATITVSVANAAPIAGDDFAATPPRTAIVLDILSNDNDANGDALTVTAVTQPAGGVVVINADRTITFTPADAFRGTAVFTYTISDGTDSATATVEVVVPNTSPVAVPDFASTPTNTAATVAVLANDLDDNGDVLTVVAVTQPAGGAIEGIASINSDGTLSFVPGVGFRGDAAFTYTISDGTQQATTLVTVAVQNAMPIAVDDSVDTAPSTSITIPVLDNDSDANGDALTVVGVGAPMNGSVSVDAFGAVIYTPVDGFRGTDTFLYVISDGTDTATATINVTVPNTPPVAGADRTSTSSNSPVAIPVLVNDFDANNDALSVVPGSVSAPQNGSASLGSDGLISYRPYDGFAGLDTFTYLVSDGVDLATGTVTVLVLNGPPTAVDDSATTAPGQSVQINLLSNDSDPNGDALSVLSVSIPQNGTVVLGDDGTIGYLPTDGFLGTESFAYVISDGTDTSTAMVTVTVTSVSVAPTPLPTIAPVATAPVPITPVTPASVPTLPVTGQDPTPWFAAGVRLILAGLALIVWERSRAFPRPASR